MFRVLNIIEFSCNGGKVFIEFVGYNSPFQNEYLYSIYYKFFPFSLKLIYDLSVFLTICGVFDNFIFVISSFLFFYNLLILGKWFSGTILGKWFSGTNKLT